LHFLNRPETIVASDCYVSVFRLLPWIPKTHPWHGWPVDVVYRALAERYLRAVQNLREAADGFYNTRLEGAPVTAVHVRGTDKRSEMGKAFPGPEKYFPLLDREDSACRIFLLTDDMRVLDAFRQRYGERIVTTDCQRGTGDIGLHLHYATDRV